MNLEYLRRILSKGCNLNKIYFSSAEGVNKRIFWKAV